LSDFWPHGEVAQKYGVLRSEGYTERAIFIIDREGVIQYIDIHDIDDQPFNDILFAELRRIDPEAASNEPPKPPAAELPEGGIVMYCTKWCTDCYGARHWLEDRDLEYTEVDIYEFSGALEQVREWGDGKLITPTFDIDGEIVVDFDEEKLERLLG
jgi:glutaredoxin